MPILKNAVAQLENGFHHWTEGSKTHSLDLNFAFSEFSYREICISKVQPLEFKKFKNIKVSCWDKNVNYEKYSDQIKKWISPLDRGFKNTQFRPKICIYWIFLHQVMANQSSA